MLAGVGVNSIRRFRVGTIHIHVPLVGDGDELHVHLHIARAGGNGRFENEEAGFTLTEQAEGIESDEQDRVERILDRWERFTTGTPAREVADQLAEQGWEPHPPTPQAGSRTVASYIRYVYAGRTRRAVLYLNSVALVSNSSRDRDFLGTLAAAEQSGRETYFRFEGPDGVTNALAAAEALRLQADGE